MHVWEAVCVWTAESVSVHRHVLGGEPGNVVGAVTFAFLSRGHDPLYFQVIELQKQVNVSTWSSLFSHCWLSKTHHGIQNTEILLSKAIAPFEGV